MRGELRAGRREAAGDCAVHAACRGEGATAEWGGGEERTANIQPMFVTRDVSKLSGWLNLTAACRGSQGGETVRGELRAGRREAAGDRVVHAACRGEGATAEWGGAGSERTLNMALMSVTREVSKLIGWFKALAPCRGSQGGETVWGELRGPGGGRRRATAVCAQRAGERARLQIGGLGAGRSAQ